MESFKIRLDIIAKKITASIKMHKPLKTSEISSPRTCSSKDCSVCIDESSPWNKTPMHRSIENP